MTKEQALNANEFHFGECKCIIGPRGGKKYKQDIWRRNGMNKLWKTRPDDFRIPIKTGFRGPYDYITQDDLKYYNDWHTSEDCPIYNKLVNKCIQGTIDFQEKGNS